MSEHEAEDLSDVDQEDEDEEPKLRYQRLGMDVVKFLETDEATSMCVHQKFLVCAPTHVPHKTGSGNCAGISLYIGF